MKKIVLLSLLCFVLISFFASVTLEQKANAATRGDKTELEGKWVLQGSNMTFVFSEEKYEITAQNVWYKGTFSIKTSTDPKEIDLVIEDTAMAQFKGQTSLGIYAFKEGILFLAMNRPGADQRPTQFQPGGDIQVFMLKKSE